LDLQDAGRAQLRRNDVLVSFRRIAQAKPDGLIVVDAPIDAVYPIAAKRRSMSTAS
jgi:hypothetical protein